MSDGDVTKGNLLSPSTIRRRIYTPAVTRRGQPLSHMAPEWLPPCMRLPTLLSEDGGGVAEAGRDRPVWYHSPLSAAPTLAYTARPLRALLGLVAID